MLLLLVCLGRVSPRSSHLLNRSFETWPPHFVLLKYAPYREKSLVG